MNSTGTSPNALRPLSYGRTLLAGLVLSGVLLAAAPLAAQIPEPARDDATPAAQAGSTAVRLPGTAEETARALRQLDAQVAEVRERAATAAPEAPPEELDEWRSLFQQWAVALGAQSASLRRLEEIRRVNRNGAAEAQAWRGFTEKPPYHLVLLEELRDAVGAQRLEVQTDQMMLAMSESSLARGVALLAERRKQLRLVQDQAGQATAPDPRRQWLLRLAEVRVRSSEAVVEAAEVARRVTLERLGGLRQYLEFLERKLALAEPRASFTQADLDGVLARLNERRGALRRELDGALASQADVALALAAARDSLRRAEQDAAANPTDRLKDRRALVATAQARGETAELKVSMLRTFLVLADLLESVWQDRFWVTGNRPLAELRSKRQACQESLQNLRPWRRLTELKLSAASSEALAQSIRAAAPGLTTVESDSARQIQTAMEERTGLYQRALSSLALLEGAHERLLADLAAQEARVSPAGKARFVFDRLASFCRRIWDTELYVAEDSVIADGQKISVPRPITLGKVAIALGIFLAGLLVALRGQGAVRKAMSRWCRAGEQTAGAVARFIAGCVVVVAFCAAMTSVRIPWTVFAFLGGALAIGVGFGAQTLINNFISGVILLLERSIRVGDIVEVGDQRGKVVRLGFRNSLVKRGDGIDVLVPNSKFLETEVINWTLTDDLVRYKISIGVAYGSRLETVAALIAQAAAENPAVMKHPAPQVLLDDFGDNAMLFTLAFWMRLRPSTDGGVVRSELRCRVYALFDQAGVVLAFPQRDVHLDAVRPLDVRLVQATPPPSPRSEHAP